MKVCVVTQSHLIQVHCLMISSLNAQWRIGHQQVSSIPVGPLQAVKLSPRMKRIKRKEV